MLERMPVIEKNSPDHTNGESAGESVKEIQPGKVKQGEPLLPQQPANQVQNNNNSKDAFIYNNNVVKV